MSRRAPRIPAARRAVVGLVWAFAWMVAWGGALAVFATRAHAQPLALAVSDGPVSLPIYVAEARGLFAAEGLALRTVACRSGRECWRALAEGRAELATASEMVVALEGESRPDFAIIATVSASAYQMKIVARRSAHVIEAPQVRGKRIGTVAGTSAQYFLDSWLVFSDVDPRTVTVVPLAPDRLVDALQRRQVDAIAIWEPLASTAAAALGADAVVMANPRVYTQHFNLVADRATIARRETDLVRLLRALVAAQRLIAADPAGAQAILASRLGLAPALAAAAIADQDYRVRLDQSLVTTMQGQLRWAALAASAAGPRPGARPRDLLRAIEPGPLRQAAPDAVGLAGWN
jgi:NitT/TauT family transport system substrate-binding protein